MEEKKEVIEISIKLQKEIAGKFRVSEKTVQLAMRFETHSPSARLLRSYAMNHGGELYEITKKKMNNPYRDVVVL